MKSERNAFEWSENEIKNSFQLFGMQENENETQKCGGSHIKFFHPKCGMKIEMKIDSKTCFQNCPPMTGSIKQTKWHDCHFNI